MSHDSSKAWFYNIPLGFRNFSYLKEGYHTPFLHSVFLDSNILHWNFIYNQEVWLYTAVQYSNFHISDITICISLWRIKKQRRHLCGAWYHIMLLSFLRLRRILKGVVVSDYLLPSFGFESIFKICIYHIGAKGYQQDKYADYYKDIQSVAQSFLFSLFFIAHFHLSFKTVTKIPVDYKI